MALDTLPDDGIEVKTRDAMRDLWLRSVRIRNPLASTAQDTQPWIDASVASDVLAPMSMNARVIGRSIPLSEVSGVRLDQRLNEYGLPPRFPETGSQGSVKINASSGGAIITAGDEFTDNNLSLRFKCTSTGLYQDQSLVPCSAIDTGTQTNIAAGVPVTWSQGIAGLFASATVAEQTDGTGFSGGRGAESDDEVRSRISSALANPAAAGNDAEYQSLVENSLGHGVSVQKCFTFRAINGPGTIGVAFTMKPAVTGGSRRPNPTQMSLVQSYVVGKLPGDDSYLPVTLIAQPTDIAVDVSWTLGANGWADVVQWPVRYDVGAGAIVVSSATNASSFTLATDTGSYVGVDAPVAGNNIAFFDKSGAGKFRQKRLLSVTGTGPWICVADITNGASDTTYTPYVGQRACPWSKSLDTLTTPITDYFGTMGPGEQRAVFFDPAVRERRNPVSPKNWPNIITSKIETALVALTSVNDLRVRDGLGSTTNIGTPGANSYIIELRSISAFPL